MVAPATPRPVLAAALSRAAAVLKRDDDKYGTALRAAGVKPK